MWPDQVSNPGPLTYKTGALPTVLCSPVSYQSSHFSIFASFDSLYRGSIFVLYISQSDLQTEETGLLSNWFYCFQSANAYSCFICFQIISGISGGWADWNISKFPVEDCVAEKGTSVNFLKRICVLILYILKLLF